MPKKSGSPNVESAEDTSRSAVSKKRRGYAVKKTPTTGPAKVKEEVTQKTKYRRYYPTMDEAPRRRIPRGKNAFRPTRLRSSITPGTVLILLSGRFRGKRVVFLKQLPSGLLLVTGPFKINGVPLRRVCQSYVIATSTKVDISKVTVPDDLINDKTFRKERLIAKKKKTEDAFFTESEEKKELPKERIECQKQVDGPILEAIKGVPLLKDFIGARFTLTRHMVPHALAF